MSACKISVIIPVYNASKYLHSCIDSILAQTFSDFELICVDDGSTDDSLSILTEYKEQDSRVQVLTQSNQYAGVARNTGKAIARGDYLVFWDSDDFFHPRALELMYDKCIEDDADICVCSANHYFEDIQKSLPSVGYISKQYVPKELPFSRDTVPDYILNITTAHPWNKMFRRAYIEALHLDFQSTRNGNDIFFVINAIARANRITIVNKPLINYRINQANSLFGSLTVSPLTPIHNWIATRDSLIANNAYPKRSFDNKILNTLVYFLHNISDWNAFRETLDFLQTEGLAKLDLTEQDDEYYYSVANAECLHHLLHDSAEEFLIFFANLTYRQANLKNGQNQELTKRLNRSKKLHREDVASLNDRIHSQQQLIEAKSERIEKQMQKQEALSGKIEKLREVNSKKTEKIERQITLLTKKNEKIERQAQLIDKKTAKIAEQLKKQNDMSKTIRAQSDTIRAQSERIAEQARIQNELTKELERSNKKLRDVLASRSYRLGRFLTAIPRKIRQLLKG